MSLSIFEPHFYSDPDGLLPLANAQKLLVKSYYRIHEIFGFDPRAIKPQIVAIQPNPYEIQQSLSGDNYMIASIAALANQDYKSRNEKRMISSLIFPQDEIGNPIYNPTGKYVVKLFLNGIWREVDIDDYYPCDGDKKPLCLTSSRRENVWVSLLEKAYLKAKGIGYNRISNPGAEVYAMSSWIPERIMLNNVNPEILWAKLAGGAKNNDCMICMTTGDIKEEAEKGLRSHTSYAILEVIRHGDWKILLVRNSIRTDTWKGVLSLADTLSWSDDLKTALGFESMKAYIESGVIFFMDFDSAIKYFETVDINWNPAPLAYRRAVWDIFHISELMNEEYNLYRNPQYSIEFFPSPNDSLSEITFWVLANKLTISEEPCENEDFIGISAFENSKLSKISYDEIPLNELVLRNDEQTLYKFSFSKERLKMVRFVNIVVRTHFLKKDLRYR